MFPILTDEDFLNSYPGIYDVVFHLYSANEFDLSQLLRTESIQNWLVLLQEGNEEAIKKYEIFRMVYSH